ncbi:FG-GAP-like repeat-containing protein [Hymenobacter sp. J193]|uniref:beta strand repeat-containing protein n=1 Tax=Hymenobacter sp. J193 TaxID=2898429 RepID=UPI00215179C9|nr:FG-GAP-like repeat-containing protein [Hymenobacter sp. J193]MCR5887793.1 FG-GAP-like repeat-containing protein [Hymenobacter sp. J193]
MKQFLRLTSCLRRGYGPTLTVLLLALLPLLVHAGTPVLTFQATEPGSAGTNVMAFVDQVEIVNASSGVVMASAVPNASFETFTAPLQFTNYGPNPAGASWTFDNRSGIGRVGGDLTPPPTASGSYVGYVQTADGVAGAFRQTVPNLVPGLYRVRLRVAQRNIALANQGVRVLVDGVALGTVVPANNGAFAIYNSATFMVARPSTSRTFFGGANLTTDGSTALDVGFMSAPAVTDVDGDGLLDLLVGEYDSGYVLRYEQTTAGGLVFSGGLPLTTNGSTALSAGTFPRPTVTDVDGDGLLDLLVGNFSGNVLRYEQTAAGGPIFAGGAALTTNGTTALGVSGGKAAPTVTDVDGNGLLDLLVGNGNGNVFRYEQTAAEGLVFAGGAALTTNGSTALNAGSNVSVTVTDVDGNGQLDLLIGNDYGEIKSFEQTAVNGLLFAAASVLVTAGSSPLNGNDYTTPVVTDVDGDGLLDLLTGNNRGTVRRFEQADPPIALALTPRAVAENGASGTVVGTFSTTDNTSGDTFTYTLVSGDGSADNARFTIGTGANAGKLVTNAGFDFETRSSYSVRVRSTDATGLFTEQFFTIIITDAVEAPTLTGVEPGSGPLGTTITITGTNLTGLTSVLVGEVPALFTVTSNTSATATVPRQATSQRVRVSNAAGTALSATAFTVTRPSASGVFPGGAALTTNGTTLVQPNAFSAPAVTDVDQDGLLDLLVGNQNGSVWRYEQTTANGDQFASAGALTDGTSPLNVAGYAIVAVTDVDGDGLLDLLVSNAFGDVLRYEQTATNGGNFAGQGSLTTNGTTPLNVGNYANLAVTDADGDGLIDLLVSNNAGNIQRYEQAAANSSSFGAVAALTDAGGTPLALGNIGLSVTDLDSDGLLDMLVGRTSGRVTRYEQTAPAANSFTSLNDLTTNGTTVIDAGDYTKPAVTDIDGDGLLDLLLGSLSGTVLRYEQSDPPTALALSPQAVAENAASGTVVGTFSTTDATPGDIFTYTLVTGTGSDDNATFAIGTGANAGQLLTAAVFDFETRSSYSIRVRTTDATGLAFEQVFAISITDVADPPVLTSFAPLSGPLGTTITLTGRNLTGLTSVLVGEVPARFTVTSSTSATVIVPRQATSQKVRISRTSGLALNQGTALSSLAFQVARPSTSYEFPGGAALTTNGTTPLIIGRTPTPQFGNNAAPAVTDLDNDGLLDILGGMTMVT